MDRSVCHSVIPEVIEESDSVKYQAASPDEEALVSATCDKGVSQTDG